MKQRICIYFINIFLLSISSCQEEEQEYDKTATVRFDLEEAIYQENGTNVKIGVTLDHIRNENVVIKANINTNDTSTYRDIDYGITPQLLIKPFSNSGYFQLSIIDDKQIDLNDQIELILLQPQSGNIKLSEDVREQKFTLTIENNDILKPGNFQADLSWRRKNPIDQVNLVNLDLYVQTNVLIENGIIYDIGDTFAASTEFSSFETVHIADSAPDQPYYLVVYFNLTHLYDVISYQLTLNGFGFINENYGGVFLDSDVGTAIVYGPFIKDGNRIIGSGRKNDSPPIFCPKINCMDEIRHQ